MGPLPYAVPNSNGLEIKSMQLVSFEASPTEGRFYSKLRITANKDGVIGSSISFHDLGLILTTTPTGGTDFKVTECFEADPLTLGRTFSKSFDTIKEIPYPAPGEFNKAMPPPGTPFPKPTSNPEVEITELKQTIKLPRAAFAIVQIKLNVYAHSNPRDYLFRLRADGVTGKLYDKSSFNGLVSRNIGGTVYLSWSGELPGGETMYL